MRGGTIATMILMISDPIASQLQPLTEIIDIACMVKRNLVALPHSFVPARIFNYVRPAVYSDFICFSVLYKKFNSLN